MDLFASSENVLYLSNTLGLGSADQGRLRQRVLDIARRYPQLNAMPPMERVRRLNEVVISTFRQAQPSFPPGPVRRNESSPPRPVHYRDDELVVVLNSADRDWADHQPNPYDFTVKLDGDPTSPGISLDEHIRQCTVMLPICLYMPMGSPIRDSAFLVLATSLESSNQVVSSQRKISGTNVIMSMSGFYGSLQYDKFINLTQTTLRTRDPTRRLGHFRLRFLAPDGTALSGPEPADGGVTHKYASAALLFNVGTQQWKLHVPDAQAYYQNTSSYDLDFVVDGVRVSGSRVPSASAELASAVAAVRAAGRVVVRAEVVTDATALTTTGGYTSFPLTWLSMRPTTAVDPHIVLKAHTRVRDTKH